MGRSLDSKYAAGRGSFLRFAHYTIVVVEVKAAVLIVLTAAGWKKATTAIDFFSNSQGDGPAE